MDNKEYSELVRNAFHARWRPLTNKDKATSRLADAVVDAEREREFWREEGERLFARALFSRGRPTRPGQTLYIDAVGRPLIEGDAK